MAVIQCPHYNLEVKLVEGVSGLPIARIVGKNWERMMVNGMFIGSFGYLFLGLLFLIL